MKPNRYTDGLATVAAGIAVVAAMFLFTGVRNDVTQPQIDGSSWSEPFAALKSEQRRSDG